MSAKLIVCLYFTAKAPVMIFSKVLAGKDDIIPALGHQKISTGRKLEELVISVDVLHESTVKLTSAHHNLALKARVWISYQKRSH